jgi:hypothetical protein
VDPEAGSKALEERVNMALPDLSEKVGEGESDDDEQ